MTIPHQTLVDANGQPVAVQIPWEDFQQIQRRLEQDEDSEISTRWRQELHRRSEEIDSGRVQLIEGEAFLERLRTL